MYLFNQAFKHNFSEKRKLQKPLIFPFWFIGEKHYCTSFYGSLFRTYRNILYFRQMLET